MELRERYHPAKIGRNSLDALDHVIFCFAILQSDCRSVQCSHYNSHTFYLIND